MQAEVKAKWVAALRSGEYAQGRSQLRADDRFCCLGVLCDLYRKDTGDGTWTVDDWFEVTSPIEASEIDLPFSVQQWAQLDSACPVVLDDACVERGLAAINDTGASFENIAALIEARL